MRMCVKRWWTNIATYAYIYTLYMCVCVYVSLYMYIFMLPIWWICLQNIIYAILCMQHILQMWAIADCAWTCRHWGYVSVFIDVYWCHSQNALKGNFLKFRISLQVKLRLQVIQFWSQLYILQCHLTEDTLLVCGWWNAEHLQIAHPYSSNGESSLA